MAQFPIEIDDQAAISEGLNYLLSGPAGLGQNFAGFSSYTSAYIRPAGRQPFSLPIDTTLNPAWYLDIPISNIVPVSPQPTREITVTFASAQPTAPFQYGDVLGLSGVIDDGSGETYDFSSYEVLSCTTTQVVLYVTGSYTWANYISGGSLIRNRSNQEISTDCNGRITVTGPTDQVFISAQLILDAAYTCSTASEFDIVVSIDRFRGNTNNQAGNNDYIFTSPVTVSKRTFTYTPSTSGTVSELETIFTTVLDGPDLDFGYYWYILQVRFDIVSGDVKPGNMVSKLRSLTAQVVKQ